jgi:hypothetical protein
VFWAIVTLGSVSPDRLFRLIDSWHFLLHDNQQHIDANLDALIGAVSADAVPFMLIRIDVRLISPVKACVKSVRDAWWHIPIFVAFNHFRAVWYLECWCLVPTFSFLINVRVEVEAQGFAVLHEINAILSQPGVGR